MNKRLKNLLILIVPGLLYLLTSLPLRQVLSVFTITDVRPSAAIVPLFSMWFGPLASFSLAIGNFISDYICDNPLNVLIQGIPLQLIYGLVPWFLWKKLTKGDDHSYRLDSISKVMKFILIALAFGTLSGIGVGYLVITNYGVPFMNTFKFVFLNNFDMTILIGGPAMILANLIISKKKGEPIRRLSINEIIILLSIVVAIIGSVIIGINIYNNPELIGTYDVWNTIYLKAALFVNIVIVVSIIVMTFIKKK